MEPPPFPASARIHRTDSLISADLAGNRVLLSVEEGKYFGFEVVGGRVWDLLSTPTTLAEICAQLETEFDVDADQCRRDVGAFLSQLQRSSLITVDDGTGA